MNNTPCIFIHWSTSFQKTLFPVFNSKTVSRVSVHVSVGEAVKVTGRAVSFHKCYLSPVVLALALDQEIHASDVIKYSLVLCESV